MKKMMFLFIALFAITFALVSFKSANLNNAAIIDKDFGCLLWDGNDVLVLADASHAVVTSSGNHTLKCSATVDNPSGKAIQYRGRLCNAYGALTDDSHETISASGQATLTCKVR